MSIEISNAKQEIKEIVEKCIQCGLCKPLCPVFQSIREEPFSPRGKAILLDNNYIDKLVHDCTLCKACEHQCPIDIPLYQAIINARKILVYQKKELPENKEMINNLNKTGNIFGEKEEI